MKDITASMKDIADIVKKNVDITEKSGYIIYSSDEPRVGTIIPVTNSVSFYKCDRHYIHIEGGSSEEVSLAGLILKDKLIEGTADNIQQFLINILDGSNISKEDSDSFNIHSEESYIIYCISSLFKEHFQDTLSLLSNSFYEEENTWVFPYDSYIILIQKVDNFSEKIKATARTIRDMINSEVYAEACIGVGGIHNGIEGIRKSYLESKEAVDIGSIFNLPDNIYLYKDILIERIINQIPEGYIEELEGEFFSNKTDGILDEEMLKTADALFKNNLNISDSSRILYIHRNTLLYRLDKIQRITGMDIRKFEDAVTFKLMTLLKARRKP